MILLVDDDPFLLEALSDRLQLSLPDVQVVTCDRPEAALELLQRQRFAVLITDIRMPGMDGMALLRAAKAMRPELCVIVMTAFTDVHQDQVTAAGGMALLKKPFSGASLIDTVQSALDQSSLDDIPC